MKEERGKRRQTHLLGQPRYRAICGLIATDGTRFEDVLEGVAFEEPRYLMAASPFAATGALTGISMCRSMFLLGCERRSSRIATASQDAASAWRWWIPDGIRHPLLRPSAATARPARCFRGPVRPTQTDGGRGGTRHRRNLANIFAVAPDVELLPVKAMLVWLAQQRAGQLDGGLQRRGRALNPHIITNSWGFSIQNGPLSAAQQALGAAMRGGGRRLAAKGRIKVAGAAGPRRAGNSARSTSAESWLSASSP